MTGLLRRSILFRLAAMLSGLGVLVMCEAVLRLVGWGQAPDLGDPFVGFSEVRPLFVRDASGESYEIPESRQAFFQPESFAAHKGPHEFRIFCLGGSTVQGRPYSIETSFTTWLELSLRAADPSRRWEVVNCGGVSYASYRLVPIMREVLAYEPDLFIVYTGHNEFLEDRSYARIKRLPVWVKTGHRWLTDLRLYGLICRVRMLVDGPTRQPKRSPRATLPAEVDALLDYEGGLADYHRDDRWRGAVTEHFGQNLRRMARIASNARVGLLLLDPVSNLRDSPPFKTLHRAGLSAEERQTFERLWHRAKAAEWTDTARKTDLLQQALRIDGRHADAHFLLAKVHEAVGRHSAAKAEYVRAKDEDICPLRMLEVMHRSLRAVAEQTGTRLLPVRQAFERKAVRGIPGDDLLIDHVHPRIDGHQFIAQLVLEELTVQGIVTPRSGWRVRQQKLYDQRWRTLAENYFPESVARLRGLQNWAAGRGLKLRIRPNEQPRAPLRTSPRSSD